MSGTVVLETKDDYFKGAWYKNC